MSADYPRVVIKPGKENSIRRFHPWVFSGAIKSVEKELKEGEVVEVYTDQQEYLATGHFHNSSIAVRLISFQQQTIDLDFWKTRIQAAYNVRRELGLTDSKATNAYRLIHAEGDRLPGLIIDFYNGTAILQAHSIGMNLAKNDIAEALKFVYKDKLKAVYDKSAETLPGHFANESGNSYLFGSFSNNEILENDCRFAIDWQQGQKTGFFLDQRFNRSLLGNYAKGKDVLNTFCYSGGFSIYALKAGALSVDSVDSSKKAIQLTEQNIKLNGFQDQQHRAIATDAIDFLKDIQNRYDVIVLDPPAFAKHLGAKHKAIQAYKRINALAIKQIKAGGIIFTFSCSQVVDRNLFNSAVMAAAIETGRNVRILHQLSQPPDHAMSIFHPEGEYLKGLVLRVE